MMISENKKKILRGIEKVRDIIIHTYGPQGRTWLLGNLDNYHINDDGYKIIKQLSFEDEYENMGLKLVLDMVSKTENEAHDATTLVTLLATSFLYEIYESNLEIVPQIFMKEWDECINQVIEILHNQSTQNIEIEDLKSIARICVKENELGDIIGDTIYKLGSKGQLITNISDNDNTYVEFQKGYILEDFFDGKHVINHIESKWTNVKVLIISETLDSLIPLINIIKELKDKKEKLLLICFNYYDDVLDSLLHLLNENIYILPYKLRGYKNMQMSTVEDIQMICGAKEYKKNELFTCSIDELKSIEEVEITNSNICLFYKDIVNIFDGIKDERKAKLLGNHACIYVGGSTLNVKNERMSRIEDAKYSCFNTLKYGYVLGGGKTLYNIAEKMNNDSIIKKIISNSLKIPFKALLDNSGFIYDENLILLDNEGINLYTHKVISLKEEKIFDCVYGLERALLNASGLVYTIIHLYDAKIEKK